MVQDAAVGFEAQAYLAQRRATCKLAEEEVEKLVVATETPRVIVAVVLGHNPVELVSRYEVDHL